MMLGMSRFWKRVHGGVQDGLYEYKSTELNENNSLNQRRGVIKAASESIKWRKTLLSLLDFHSLV